MRILIQWATSVPSDWIEVSSRDWDNLPSKGEPSAGDTIDTQPGWITALNIQGVIFNGYDHYAVVPRLEDGGEALDVYAWSDDPDDWAGKEYGSVWTFGTLAVDPNIGMRYNTRQTSIIFVQGKRLERAMAQHGFNQTWRHWHEWESPAVETVRHGIWLPDELHEAHVKARASHNWREWTEGVPLEAIRSGLVVI